METALWPVIERKYVRYSEIKFVNGIFFHCAKRCYCASPVYCWRFTLTPSDGSSGRHRDLYLTTHNTNMRHPCPRGIRDMYPSKLGAAETSRRLRGHWDRMVMKIW